MRGLLQKVGMRSQWKPARGFAIEGEIWPHGGVLYGYPFWAGLKNENPRKITHFGGSLFGDKPIFTAWNPPNGLFDASFP